MNQQSSVVWWTAVDPNWIWIRLPYVYALYGLWCTAVEIIPAQRRLGGPIGARKPSVAEFRKLKTTIIV